jgi:hypothetical protein
MLLVLAFASSHSVVDKGFVNKKTAPLASDVHLADRMAAQPGHH